ncbi:MAG: hypothetical protein CME19_04540 [Gemmatimonadetes bacterium]|nr:hypothetical protein [Gemmatimonadota bacterium]|tara:strand:+ start:1640 stop:2434 length:795 start_codon:yes stop_codon:yes gene_type:complete
MLTEAEITQFKKEGYLVKRGIIDQDYCARARERLWDDPAPSMKQDDPDSWVGPFKQDEESEDPQNFKRGYRWQYRKVGKEDWMVEGLSRHPFVQGVVTQLLGEDRFTQPKGVRGIYCTLPQANAERKPRHVHIDEGPSTLGFVCYVDRVDPDGGGFTVWPRSHKRMYYTSSSRHLGEYGEAYQTVKKDLDETWESSSVQTFGDPGDIVIWHHRMAHMASHNYTANIRKAVLTDFRFKNIDELKQLAPDDDMWIDWSYAIRDACD